MQPTKSAAPSSRKLKTQGDFINGRGALPVVEQPDSDHAL
jgi:hypothetical protein